MSKRREEREGESAWREFESSGRSDRFSKNGTDNRCDRQEMNAASATSGEVAVAPSLMASQRYTGTIDVCSLYVSDYEVLYMPSLHVLTLARAM